MTPILATKKKNGLHFVTRASFREAPAKTESNGFQTFISHLTSAHICFRPVFLFQALLIFFMLNPKNSDNN